MKPFRNISAVEIVTIFGSSAGHELFTTKATHVQYCRMQCYSPDINAVYVKLKMLSFDERVRKESI